jgi:hypothetical protein
MKFGSALYSPFNIFIQLFDALFLFLPARDWPSEDQLTALGPGGRELLVPEGFNWSLSSCAAQ